MDAYTALKAVKKEDKDRNRWRKIGITFTWAHGQCKMSATLIGLMFRAARGELDCLPTKLMT